jgi:putative membrane protein
LGGKHTSAQQKERYVKGEMVMRLIIRLLASALAVLIAAHVIPGIEVNGYGDALIAAVVLGLLNLVIRPIIMLLTLPLNILTLGLFSWVINAFLFWVVGNILNGFKVDDFAAAFLGALLVTIISWIVNLLLRRRR